jgi:TolB protein
MNSDGSGLTPIFGGFTTDVRAGSPAWSPDGTRIALRGGLSSIWAPLADIFVSDIDGFNVTGDSQLTNDDAVDDNPTWSPDGNRIAFDSDRDGKSQIYVMNDDGSGLTRLTNNSFADTDPDWSPAAPTVGPFTDVASSHWAFAYIWALFDADITTGCSLDPPLYCPNDLVTRAQMATFIVRAMGEESNLPSYQGYFGDVSAGQWYTGYVERLYQLGITTGCSAVPLLYCPVGLISRAEMAAFIIRALGEDPVASPTGVFPDVAASHWAAGYIERLVQLEITAGFPDGTYRPNDPVSRAQMAAFIVRAWALPMPSGTAAASASPSPSESFALTGGFGALMLGAIGTGWAARRRWLS